MPFDPELALLIGLLIGVERGWIPRDVRVWQKGYGFRDRPICHTLDVSEGPRIAGVRTYALLGPVGGSSRSCPSAQARR